MTLDYSALSEQISDETLKQYTSKNVSLTSPKTILSVAIVMFLFIGVPMIVSVMSNRGDTSIIITVFSIMFVVLLIGTFAALYGSKLAAKESVRLHRFADANDAVYKENIAAPSMNGMIFNEGHTRWLKRSLSFRTGIEIGNSSYDKGSGKNQRTYNYTFARVALNRNLPHMVLDAKSNNFLGSNLPNAFDESQRMSLEGDFNNYFNVYAPNGYERDALYVFTPDVMKALVEQGSTFDMEIVGNELYIFKSSNMNLATQSELEGLLKIVESITDEVRDQAKRYTDERANIPATVNATGNRSIPIVAEQGARLRKRYPIGAVILFVLLVATIFVPPFLPENLSDIVVMTMWPVIIISVIVFGIANVVRGR